MKKTFLILAALLAFGIASAQTDTISRQSKKQVPAEKKARFPKKERTAADSTDYRHNRGRTGTDTLDGAVPNKAKHNAKKLRTTGSGKTAENPTGSPATPPKKPVN